MLRHDADAWAWAAAGGAARAEGDHLRASVLYAEALLRDRAPALVARQRECWAAAAAGIGARTAPFGGTVVADAVRRPMLVVDPGARTVAEAWDRTGEPARARGLHWAAFESGTALTDAVAVLGSRAETDAVLLLGLDGLAGDLSGCAAAAAIGNAETATGAPLLCCPYLYVDTILDWLTERVAT